MNRRSFLATALAASAVGAFGLAKESGAAMTYDSRVLESKPLKFFSRVQGRYWLDAAGGPAAEIPYGCTMTKCPFGYAPVFNGINQYATVAAPVHNGVLSIEAYLRPDTLNFPNDEGEGRVHWSGVGQAKGTHQWATRMYSSDNGVGRENRISGYVFAPEGGLGAGSYFQEPVTVGKWIHVVFVINTRELSAEYPMGYTRIYKNGVLKMTSGVHHYPNVHLENTVARMRIGTRDFQSYFKGAIGKFAVYPRELQQNDITYHLGV